jgi:hypothetical protein
MENMATLKERLRRLVPAAVAIASGIPFVVFRDAQWLKLDDFSMMVGFRETPIRELFKEILLTRTGPYVRFAFLEHIIFMPFYRSWFDGRVGVDAIYFAVVITLLGAGWLLCLPLRRNLLAWLAAWSTYLLAVFSVNTWNTLEFKTASYLLLGFAMAVVLQSMSWRFSRSADPPPRPWQLAWVALAIVTSHMAEVTLVVAVLLGAALVARRRLSWWALASVTAWPMAFWLANILWVPRDKAHFAGNPSGLLLANGRADAVGQALATSLQHLLNFDPALQSGALLILLGSVIVLSGRERTAIRPRMAGLLEVLAFPASGLALLLLSQLNSAGEGNPGVFVERHRSYVELCLAAGIILAIALIQEQEVPRPLWRRISLATLLLLGVVATGLRLPRLVDYVDARRDEVARSVRLGRSVRAQLIGMADAGAREPVLVFVQYWRRRSDSGDRLDATFVDAAWSQDAFRKLYICTPTAPCPPARFVSRVAVRQGGLPALCGRLFRSRVMVVANADGAASPVAMGGWSAEECEHWLRAADLIVFEP